MTKIRGTTINKLKYVLLFAIILLLQSTNTSANAYNTGIHMKVRGDVLNVLIEDTKSEDYISIHYGDREIYSGKVKTGVNYYLPLLELSRGEEVGDKYITLSRNGVGGLTYTNTVQYNLKESVGYEKIPKEGSLGVKKYLEDLPLSNVSTPTLTEVDAHGVLSFVMEGSSNRKLRYEIYVNKEPYVTGNTLTGLTENFYLGEELNKYKGKNVLVEVVGYNLGGTRTRVDKVNVDVRSEGYIELDKVKYEIKDGKIDYMVYGTNKVIPITGYFKGKKIYNSNSMITDRYQVNIQDTLDKSNQGDGIHGITMLSYTSENKNPDVYLLTYDYKSKGNNLESEGYIYLDSITKEVVNYVTMITNNDEHNHLVTIGGIPVVKSTTKGKKKHTLKLSDYKDKIYNGRRELTVVLHKDGEIKDKISMHVDVTGALDGDYDPPVVEDIIEDINKEESDGGNKSPITNTGNNTNGTGEGGNLTTPHTNKIDKSETKEDLPQMNTESKGTMLGLTGMFIIYFVATGYVFYVNRK